MNLPLGVEMKEWSLKELHIFWEVDVSDEDDEGWSGFSSVEEIELAELGAAEAESIGVTWYLLLASSAKPRRSVLALNAALYLSNNKSNALEKEIGGRSTTTERIAYTVVLWNRSRSKYLKNCFSIKTYIFIKPVNLFRNTVGYYTQ